MPSFNPYCGHLDTVDTVDTVDTDVTFWYFCIFF